MLQGRILTPDGWINGSIAFDQRIASITEGPVGEGLTIVPGFVDLHVHGASGVDIMEGGDAGAVVARSHARHGTTALLGTTLTAKEDSIRHALQGLAGVIAQRPQHGARMLGVHLEGPFLNRRRLGAQPPDVVTGSRALVESYHAIAPIRVLTMAPEVTGHLELIPHLKNMGIRVQIGHSAGSYDDGVAAMRAGAAGFTHLFNGMSGMSHKEPGMVDVAMAHAEYAEIIPDLLHVHPGAMRAALRAIPRLFCVTDSTAAAGMPDGEYSLGRHRVTKCLGGVRLPDGTLAGSTLTMDQALRNLVLKLGLPIEDASRRVSTNAADYLGLDDRGRLAPGAWADFVVLDRGLQLRSVVIEGEAIDLANAG